MAPETKRELQPWHWGHGDALEEIKEGHETWQRIAVKAEDEEGEVGEAAEKVVGPPDSHAANLNSPFWLCHSLDLAHSQQGLAPAQALIALKVQAVHIFHLIIKHFTTVRIQKPSVQVFPAQSAVI